MSRVKATNFWLVPALATALAACGGEAPNEMAPTVATTGSQALRTTTAQPYSGDLIEASRQYMNLRKAQWGLSQHDDFAFMPEQLSGPGHTRLRHTHRGVPVWGSDVVVHANSNQIVRANGRVTPKLGDFQGVANIDSADALALGKSHYAGMAESAVGSLQYRDEKVRQFVYLKDGAPHLVWHVYFFTELQAGVGPGRWNYFIDAETSEVLDVFNWLTIAVFQGSGPGGNLNITRTWNNELDVADSGADYEMNTMGEPGVHSFQTNDMANSTSGTGSVVVGPLDPVGDKDENDTHGFTEIVLDMMLEWPEKDSIDGMGYHVLSRVHYGIDYENAFWDGTQMTYGDGDIYFYALTGDIDVVGHEINHGFTERHSGLIYSAQSGGMNESFSDIAGTAAEFFHEGDGPGGADFDVGHDIAKPGQLPGDALRFMCNPTADGASIDSLDDYMNQGVHFSSGISNKAFCLAARRLSSATYDPSADATVVGVKLAAKAWYRANESYWASGSTFAEGCQGVVDAARDTELDGGLEYTAEQVTAIRQSWTDVQVPCDGVFPPIACDDVHTASTGTITSPNYPSDYPNNANHTDCIQPASGGTLTLTFDDFNTESGYDFVTVTDMTTGTDLSVTSGTTAPIDHVATELAVKFTSDGSVTRPGWQASWIADPSPTASFVWAATGLTVNFTDTSTDDMPLVAWHWDFGDGNFSTSQHPVYSYSAAGSYTVTLTVTDSSGNIDTTSQTVTVSGGGGGNVPPTSAFTYAATGLSVNFTDMSSDSDGTVTAWSWNFGDGQFSSMQSPTHMYAASGTYTVTLTVSDNGGLTGVSAQTVTVVDTNMPPTANFSYMASSLTATFMDMSTDADGSIVGWMWDFGDGNSSTAQNPMYNYAAPGTYTVNLTVTDDGGATANVSMPVTVTAPNSGPIASFTYVDTNLDVAFTDQSTDPDGTIVSWAWNFGDGNTSTAQNPNHTYAASGTYNVSLTVTDDGGASNTAAATLVVLGVNVDPSADFTWAATDLDVILTDTSTDSDGAIVGWSWDFGDGDGATIQNPSHTYLAGGDYDVMLTVTDDRGGTASVTQTVSVLPTNGLPSADFTWAATDLVVDFTDTSSDPDGSLVAWAWDFGDGNGSSDQNPSYTYAASGSYDVTLTVTDDRGDTASVTHTVDVTGANMAPVADFDWSATLLDVTFTDLSMDADGSIASWAWDFGDGGSSTDANPSHSYASAGSYDVTLTVTDDMGAEDSMTRTVVVVEDAGGCCDTGGQKDPPWIALVVVLGLLLMRRRREDVTA